MFRPHNRQTVWVVLSIFAVAAALLVLPRRLAAQCPVNTVYVKGEECCGGAEVFFLTADSADPANGISYGSSSAAYNLVTGSLAASAHVDEAYDHTSGVGAADVFTMTGASAATVTIRLALGYAAVTDPSGRTAWAGGSARLEAGGQSVETSGTYPVVDESIELQIDVVGGVPFAVAYEIVATAWGYYPTIDMTGVLSFIDLPAGAQITSCNGYGSPDVPVETTTWGRIKSLYR